MVGPVPFRSIFPETMTAKHLLVLSFCSCLLPLWTACQFPGRLSYETVRPEASEQFTGDSRVFISSPAFRSQSPDRDSLTQNMIFPGEALSRVPPATDAPVRLQRNMTRLLLGRALPEATLSPRVREDIFIPFTHPNEEREPPGEISESDTVIPFDMSPRDLRERFQNTGYDIVILSQIRNIDVARGVHREETTRFLPPGRAQIRILSEWRIVRLPEGRNVLQFSVRDSDQIRLPESPLMIDIQSTLRDGIRRLMDRTAWKAASHFLPHRRHTGAGRPSPGGGNNEFFEIQEGHEYERE